MAKVVTKSLPSGIRVDYYVSKKTTNDKVRPEGIGDGNDYVDVKGLGT